MNPSSESFAPQPSWVRWRILSVLGTIAFLSYLLRGNLSIAAPAMMADLHLSEMQWGWIMAGFPLGYALFQFPGGVWGGRIGPRKALTMISVSWGLLIAATSLLPSGAGDSLWLIGTLIGLQFLVGAAHAPVFPVIQATIERWFPVGGWAFPTGLTSSALTMGLAATAAVLPWLIGAFQWRGAFLILAPFALLTAGFWWWYGRDYPGQHPAVNRAELACISGQRKADSTPVALSQPAWLRVLKNRNALALMLSYSCMNFVFYFVFSWGYYYLVNVRGFSAQDAGFLTAGQWLGAGVGAAFGGWLCDRLCRRIGIRWGSRWPIVISNLMSAALLIGMTVQSNALSAAVLLGICFFFNQISEGPYWASCTAIGGRHTGATSGLMNTGANLMGFVNALLLAALADVFGWSSAIMVAAGFAVLAAAFMALVRADCQMDQAD